MRISIDDRTLAYDDTGGDGVPLILLHGFGADRTVWDAVLPQLAGRRVIRLDLRGCGESPRGAGPALLEDLAGDVAAVLSALHAERVAIAGHSLGGYVALAFFRMYAERVAGLAFVASHPLADTPEMASAREALAARTEREGTMDAILEWYVDRMFAPEAHERRPDVVTAGRELMARQDPQGAVHLLRGMKERLSSEDVLEDVRVPTLVVCGAQDRLVPLAWSRRIADEVPGAMLVVVDGAGHTLPLEAPDRTARELAAFAARTADPAPAA